MQTSEKSLPVFPDEIEHLALIGQKLSDALQRADASLADIDRAYRDTKRYMVDNRGDIDPHEMFQSEQSLRQIDRSGAFAVSLRERLIKLSDSPYFARIDFRAQGQAAATPYYIGRFAFTHEGELLIVDWRAPLAGMFYDNETGPAGYDAPGGRREGVLTRKRQFRIRRGEMEYALEASSHVHDEVLQRELAATSDTRMQSIIATIQREQNRIIRNETAQTLLLQGVAGSGKTSIALHRVAFLLYHHKDTLSARQVAILSPNRVFGDYISGVLPELGEEPLQNASLKDIAEVQLEGIVRFAPEASRPDAAHAARIRHKATLAFVRQMDAYIARLAETAFAPADYTFGAFSVSAPWIRARLDAYARHPLLRRLQMISEDIHARFETANVMGHDLPTPRAIFKALKGMLKRKSTLALYRDFYRESGPIRLLRLPARDTLEWNDVFPFLYLHAAFSGLRESHIRHLVIDEMQDYTPIQFAVLNRLFRCPKTILGDFGQAIHPHIEPTLDDLLALYPGAELVTLRKSYRSSFEIMRFAAQIQPDTQALAIERHGPAPQTLACPTPEAALDTIRQSIAAFDGGPYATMGILLKTEAAAQALHASLGPHPAVTLLTQASTRYAGGISIASVRMAKGLEFDAVLLPDVDEATYHTEHDRRLLYVACTRAMHRLTVLYAGERSPLLPKAT